jgi:hypothetical protein
MLLRIARSTTCEPGCSSLNLIPPMILPFVLTTRQVPPGQARFAAPCASCPAHPQGAVPRKGAFGTCGHVPNGPLGTLSVPNGPFEAWAMSRADRSGHQRDTGSAPPAGPSPPGGRAAPAARAAGLPAQRPSFAHRTKQTPSDGVRWWRRTPPRAGRQPCPQGH